MKKIITAALITVAMATSAIAGKTGVNEAYKTCAVFDKSGLLTAPCEVKTVFMGKKSIDITVKPGSDYKTMCGAVLGIADKFGGLTSGWSVNVFTPYSKRTVYFCKAK